MRTLEALAARNAELAALIARTNALSAALRSDMGNLTAGPALAAWQARYQVSAMVDAIGGGL